MLKYKDKVLKNEEVQNIAVTCYLGEDFKDKSWKENERYVARLSENDDISKIGIVSIECPIDDLIYFQTKFSGETMEGYYVKTKDDLEKLKELYEIVKNRFGNAEVSIHSDSIYDEGNERGFELKEFLDMYTLERYEVRECVCDYAIYTEDKLISQELIFDSRKNAQAVCDIMNMDWNGKTIKDKEKMKFFEFDKNYEYYALIVSKTEDEAVKEYAISVLGSEEEYNENYSNEKPKEVPEEYSRKRFIEALIDQGEEPEKTAEDFSKDFDEYLENEDADIVLIDAELC